MQTDFNGQVVVQNYVKKNECVDCAKQFREAAKRGDDPGMLNVMSNYGMQCMHQVLLAEVDRLEKENQELVLEIWHVDIEEHIPIDQSL
ncbi:unnamed protein product [Brassica rapa]|uniref:Uncharacterized protein n=1 Tax=Brassica campestris TaxID=3711 RepID=A0A8D9I1H9_BRACM|nr:unnamed protein product [Brassica rapa]